MSKRIIDIYEQSPANFKLLCAMFGTIKEMSVDIQFRNQPYIEKIVSFFEKNEFSKSLSLISDYVMNNVESNVSKAMIQILLNLSVDNSATYISSFVKNIVSFDDIENFEKTYFEYLKTMYENKVTDKGELMLEALFGISRDYAFKLMKTFQYFKNVSKYAISDSVVKLYLELEKIMSGNIDDIVFPGNDYNYVEVYKLSLLLEQYLKNTYSSQIESQTFKPNGMPHQVLTASVTNSSGDKIDVDIPIYKLPDDKMLVVHVTDAFSKSINGHRFVNNHVDKYLNFDVKHAKSHHLSTSAISNKKATIVYEQNDYSIVYGYTNWEVDALTEMGPNDIWSYSNYDIHLSNNKTSSFFDSSLLLNATYYKGYNELVFERDKTRPSYVVIYSSWSESHKEKAYQAAYDWGIPIVEVQK